MTYIEGDMILPSELILPNKTGDVTTQPTMSGALYISGAVLCYRDSTGALKRVVGV